MFTQKGALTPIQREQQISRGFDLTTLETELNRACLFGQYTRNAVIEAYDANGLDNALQMINVVQRGRDAARDLYKAGVVDPCPECGAQYAPCDCERTLWQQIEVERLQRYIEEKRQLAAQLKVMMREDNDTTFQQQREIDATWRKFIRLAPFVFAACMGATVVGRLLWIWLH